MIVEELFGLLGLKIHEEQWARGERAIEGMHKGLERIQESKFGERIKEGIALFAGYEAVKHVAEFVEQTIEAATAAKHLGERVGLTAETVQELGYAADVTGSSSEGMAVGMQHLARGLQELRTKGTGPAVDALRQIHVGLNAPGIRKGTLDQALGTIADKFAAMPDGVKKTSVAMDLFGREGTTLIPLLNKGSKGLAELRTEAERLGVVIDKEGIEKAEEFERTEKKLHATLTGLKNQAVEALLPSLQKMADSVLKWVQANREMIKLRLQQVINGIAKALQVLGKIIAFLIDHATLAKIALVALVAIFAPWLAVLSAIGAVVYDIWNAIENGQGVTARIIKGIKDKFQELKDWFHKLWEDFINELERVANRVKSNWLVRAATKLGGGGSFNVTENLLDKANATVAAADQAKVNAGAVAAGSSESTTVHVQGGDTHIHIDGTVDPSATGDAVAKKIREATKDMLRQAMDAVKGGRK